MNILITGGAVEIGAEIARELAKGNKLFVHYFNSKEAAESLREELADVAEDVVLIQADLTTQAGCDELVSKIKNDASELDVLVNNTGGLIKRESLGELTWSNTVNTFSLNVYSTMYLTSELVGLMNSAESPVIINITSIAMRNGSPSATAYGAAKSAIDSFTRGAARELGPKIRVNAIAPGIIDTRFHKLSSQEKMDTWKDASLLNKHGNTKDISTAVAFVVESQFMTGETIDINGGLFTR